MSEDKKRILICIDWYEPGYNAGGPIRSVANLVNALKEDFEFYILTSAYDLGSEIPYDSVPLDHWVDRDGVFIKYMSKANLNSSAIRGNILEINPDIIYLNSLFSKLFTLVPLSIAQRKKIRVVLAPRGMLGKGALDIKKGKKKTFLLVSRIIGLYRKITWHASTRLEQYEIFKAFGKRSKVIIAQNIPVAQKIPLDEILDRKKTGEIRFVFISRICRIKNLHLAIEALKKIKPKTPVEFNVYGHIEDEDYYAEFSEDVKEHEFVKIRYKGVLKPTEIADVYADSDYLLLPSGNENYGHAIVEAWANGCPVIISTNTPWKNLRVQDLGWDVEIDNPENLVATLQEAVDLDFASYIAMVRASYLYFESNIAESDIIEDNINLFHDVG